MIELHVPIRNSKGRLIGHLDIPLDQYPGTPEDLQKLVQEKFDYPITLDFDSLPSINRPRK